MPRAVRSGGILADRILVTNNIHHFQRQPSDLRRYLEYIYNLKRTYGSVRAYVQQERLHWDSVTPSGDDPFTNPSDYKILHNDWPYGIDENITHLVVWTKFVLAEDEASGQLTDRARDEIEAFLTQTFRREGAEDREQGGMNRDQLIWFKNWKSLKSVHAIGQPATLLWHCCRQTARLLILRRTLPHHAAQCASIPRGENHGRRSADVRDIYEVNMVSIACGSHYPDGADDCILIASLVDLVAISIPPSDTQNRHRRRLIPAHILILRPGNLPLNPLAVPDLALLALMVSRDLNSRNDAGAKMTPTASQQ